jgi:hypothetical protein
MHRNNVDPEVGFEALMFTVGSAQEAGMSSL